MKDFGWCECCDPHCPQGHKDSRCPNKATAILYRIDMYDETGTAMCNDCGDDAMDSGLFRSE